MSYTYRRYRLVRPDGSSTFESIPSSGDPAAHLKRLMAQHGAVEAQPVGPTKPIAQPWADPMPETPMPRHP